MFHFLMFFFAIWLENAKEYDECKFFFFTKYNLEYKKRKQ